MSEIKAYSETHFQILCALARYQNMTLQHFIRLGIGGNADALRRRVNDLAKCKKALVGILNFGDNPSYGRRPYMYYLTREGARTLQEAEGAPHVIRYPKSVKLFPQDYAHRNNMITALIEAENKAPALVRDLYFGKSKGSGKQATNVSWTDKKGESKSLNPDAILAVKNHLLSVEMTNGKSWNRDRFKVFSYAGGIEHISKKYQHSTLPYVLFIYEHKPAMNRFLKWAENEDILQHRNYKGLFLAKALEDIQGGNFFTPWRVLGHDQDTHIFKL